MLPISEVTNVKPKTRANEPKPSPEPAAKPDPKPKTAPTPPPKPSAAPEPEPTPEPTPAPTPAPKPEPTPAPKPQPTAAPEPEPEPVADAVPDPSPPVPRAKPKEIKDPPKDVAEDKPPKDPPKDTPKDKPKDKDKDKKDEDKPFDIDDVIAGVEDKENKDAPQDNGPKRDAGDDETKRGKGASDRETATIRDAFRSQVSRCWSAGSIAGAAEAEKLSVLIRVRLNQDGSLNGTPEYVEPDRLSNPAYRAAAEAGRRAIMQCQNYDLPADSYDLWQDIEVNFDPSKMVGL
jgi:hypothetical protein